MSDSTTQPDPAFAVQKQVRGQWRGYLDDLAPLRADLFGYCYRLTGNVWDAEDLVQDALLKVFSLLGKLDADLKNPKAYLNRTATNLWIDRVRRFAREREILALSSLDVVDDPPTDPVAARDAASQLLQKLHPQERAAVVLKDVLDLSLAETASLLNTTVGAVKSALQRGRARMHQPNAYAALNPPDKSLVERFMIAMRDMDLDTLKEICATDLTVELVGGAETASFKESQTFFAHAHFVMPEIGFGEHPRWQLIDYHGEPTVLGFRTLNGIEGINEIHRVEALDGKITRIRCYCFCPDTLRAIGDELGLPALARPYRSPSAEDYKA